MDTEIALQSPSIPFGALLHSKSRHCSGGNPPITHSSGHRRISKHSATTPVANWQWYLSEASERSLPSDQVFDGDSLDRIIISGARQVMRFQRCSRQRVFDKSAQLEPKEARRHFASHPCGCLAVNNVMDGMQSPVMHTASGKLQIIPLSCSSVFVLFLY